MLVWLEKGERETDGDARAWKRSLNGGWRTLPVLLEKGKRKICRSANSKITAGDCRPYKERATVCTWQDAPSVNAGAGA